MLVFFLFECHVTFDVIACRVSADEKTVRKWVWYVVYSLADLVDDIVSAYNAWVSSFVTVWNKRLTFLRPTSIVAGEMGKSVCRRSCLSCHCRWNRF